MSDPGDRGGPPGHRCDRDAGRKGAPDPAPDTAPAGVLPFPAGGGNGAGRLGTGKPHRAGGRRRAAGGEPPAAGPDEPEAAEAPSLAARVQSLAAQGLAEAEIRAVLELPERLDDPSEQALAEAFRNGQLLGRAQIKQAQFQAALRGRVTAQTQVLARLGEPRGEERGESEEGDVGPDGLPPEETEP